MGQEHDLKGHKKRLELGQRIRLKTLFLVFSFLLAIIAANLLIVKFGPKISIVNAFLFIGFDLTTRDYLHEQWQGRQLWGKMFLLIAIGSILSYALNRDAGPIAMASFVAFAAAGLVDTVTYSLLGNKSRLIKINGSNVASAAADSFIFPALAFGWPLLWGIVAGQFVAKVGGGFVWTFLIDNTSRRMKNDV